MRFKWEEENNGQLQKNNNRELKRFTLVFKLFTYEFKYNPFLLS